MLPAGVLAYERPVLAVPCLVGFRQHSYDLLPVDRVDRTGFDPAEPSTATCCCPRTRRLRTNIHHDNNIFKIAVLVQL